MSVQIFLQGYLHGIEEFLVSRPHPNEAEGGEASQEILLAGRSRWVALLSEVLPRALLNELGLSRILMGSSGGGQFLVVLPDECRSQAEEFLTAAAGGIREMSGGALRLTWAATENLGDWSAVRRRLTDAANVALDTPAAETGNATFLPFEPAGPPDNGDYFSRVMGVELRDAGMIGWSPETPARMLIEDGKYTWPLQDSADAVALARHTALDDAGNGAADLTALAGRAQGRQTWGLLRGDVDNFEFRIRRLQTIEEHVQLSMLYKQFFAGELQTLCSLPEFWRKVSILYSGGHDFAVYGSWDALVALAREVQRLFHRFNEENLKDIPGTEGKTISMALAMATEKDAALADIYLDAGQKLEIAKSTAKDTIHVFGHTVEWRQVAHAADLQEALGRLVREFGGSPQLLGDLISFYRHTDTTSGNMKNIRFDRPWRYHRRLSLVAEGARDREYQKLRTRLVTELIGKTAAQARLRPGGRVALEWAMLLAEA